MELPEEDIAYLNDTGLPYDFVADGENGGVVFRDYRLAKDKYDHETTNLLICVPKGYNDAMLDNFYVDPPLKLKASSSYPQNADHFEDHAGRNWQRFSRHLPKWRAGVDRLKNFMPLVHAELQDRK
jgi:Prokaryotic E2 family E